LCGKEQLVHFHLGLWTRPQQNYSTIQKEILSVVFCISKFKDDLFYIRFLLHCKSAKEILQKDVKNLVLKQIFPRWQAILFAYNEKKWDSSKAIFFTKEILQKDVKEYFLKLIL